MKVYDCPEEITFEPDYSNYDHKKEQAREEDHQERLKNWMIANGYTGKNTGGILLEPHADGYAQYMLADAPRKSCLIHLPYGDAWHSQNVEFLPKREVLKRIKARKNVAKMFA